MATFPSPIYPKSEEWLDTAQSRWLNIPETDDWQRRSLVHHDAVLYSPSSFAQTTIAAHHYQMEPDIDRASALSLQSKNVIRNGGGAFDPHCILDSICIPSPSYKSTVDSRPSSISPPRSASRNLMPMMPMMPSITDDSVLDMNHSLTNPWDSSSNSTQKAFSGLCGLEPLTSVTHLPDTLFESYFHNPPPPDFTIQPVGVPESSSSGEDTNLVSVSEGDPSQTSNRHQESHPPQGTHRLVASNHEAPPDVTLSQSVQLGDRALLNSGQIWQDCGLSSVQKWRSLETGYSTQMQPLMDILPPTQYPTNIYGNGQQLQFLTRPGPWIREMEVNHSDFSGDVIWKQGQEIAWDSGHDTNLDLSKYVFLHPCQEGAAESCEDTDLEYYGHGGQSFGYLTPSPSTLKRRRRLSAEETAFLVSQFCINVKPTAQERQVFAKHLNLDRRRIQVWFQNRRAKLKREETIAHNE
ncbi:hypothetical protein MVEG_00285 [Podila verticillata NRRL 6337]|nr:hypothetical protein MVEG_00285 [Podila verticillata NRRL 6337]